MSPLIAITLARLGRQSYTAIPKKIWIPDPMDSADSSDSTDSSDPDLKDSSGLRRLLQLGFIPLGRLY